MRVKFTFRLEQLGTILELFNAFNIVLLPKIDQKMKHILTYLPKKKQPKLHLFEKHSHI